MATTLFRRLGDQFCDAGGNPLAGGKLKYERAGTSTLLATYLDAAGTIPNTQTLNRIILDSAGRLLEPIYIGTDFDAKETLYTSADVVVSPWPFDNIPKAVDVGASLSDFAKPKIDVTPDSVATVNLTTADLGKSRLANTASNSITYNLPSSAAAGNGKPILIKKISASNTVTVDADGADTIDGFSTLVWSANREAYLFVPDAANWHVFAAFRTIASTFDGISSLTEDTAPNTFADFVSSFDTSAGVAKKVRPYLLGGAVIAIIEDQKASGTPGGTFTSGADRTRDLNTLVYNFNSLVSVASNQFTLPAGTWEIIWSAPTHGSVGEHQTILRNVTGSADLARGESKQGASTVYLTSCGSYVHTISASNTYEIRHRCTVTNSTTGFGVAAALGTEVYTRVIIRRA